MLRVNEFDRIAKTPLDEWIKFLKTGEIDKNATAKGLPEAREKLRIDSLPEAEKRAYYRDMEAIRYQRSVIKTGWYEGRAEGRAEGRVEGRAEGRAEGLKEGKDEGLKEGMEKGKMQEKLEIAASMKKLNIPLETIALATGLTVDVINSL